MQAQVQDAPPSHNGTGAFTFRISFTQPVTIGAAAMRDHAVTATGGSVTGARKVNGQADLWEITVQPDSNDTVTIFLSPTTDCASQGALCTEGGQKLTAGAAFRVPGPAAHHITVPDAEADEDSDANMEFVVSLSPASSFTVTVDYATEDGTATAGLDYTSASGTLTFAPGDTEQTVYVPIADDTVDDDGETFKLVLSNASGATLSDAEAQGVIRNMESNQQQANSPATGQPTISGTTQVGKTLEADTSGVGDADGISNATFSYQWLADDTDISGATGSTYTLVSGDQGKTVKVRVSFTDDADNDETLTSTATAAVAGAPADPLTASLENASASHNGTDAFTFELRFSEEVKLSYKTLRDHSFTVTGGTVKKAQRMEQGSNLRWRITVQPDANGAVTIVLPVTTDCDDTDAVCTANGRMLSNRLELSVAGPDG